MPTPSIRGWIAALALALLGLRPALAAAQPIPAGRPATVRTSGCRLAARRLIGRAALTRRINERIALLLNAKHYHRAATALRKAAVRHSDAWAGYALGGLYAAGLGVPPSAPGAFHWYLWAARRGNRFAQRQVANAYLQGAGTPRNGAAAAYWFRIGIATWQLAGSDSALAQTYARGHLAPVNRRKAAYYTARSLALLRSLAREPNGEAAYFLGLAYAYGRGVRADRVRAMHYLCRAVALRYTPAAAAVGRLGETHR